MPRREPPNSLSLLLPATSSSSSSTTASTSTPTLDVLILAQRLARDKGQYLDIQSHMNDEQLKEYRTDILNLAPIEPIKEESPVPVPLPLDNSAPPTPAGTATAVPTPTIKSKIPDLSHLHWKQRQKRLAELAREAEMIERGELDPALLEREREREREREKEDIGGKSRGEITDKDKEGIRASASYWNSLLIQARKSRGPQWDYNTQQKLFDRRTKSYYTHGLDAPNLDLPSEHGAEASSTVGNGNGTGLNGNGNGNGPSQSPKLGIKRKSSEANVDMQMDHDNELTSSAKKPNTANVIGGVGEQRISPNISTTSTIQVPLSQTHPQSQGQGQGQGQGQFSIPAPSGPNHNYPPSSTSSSSTMVASTPIQPQPQPQLSNVNAQQFNGNGIGLGRPQPQQQQQQLQQMNITPALIAQLQAQGLNPAQLNLTNLRGLQQTNSGVGMGMGSFGSQAQGYSGVGVQGGGGGGGMGPMLSGGGSGNGWQEFST